MEVDTGALKRGIQQELWMLEQQEGAPDEALVIKACRQTRMQMAQAQLSAWEELCPHDLDGRVPFRFFKAAIQELGQVLCERHLDFECNDAVVAADQVQECIPFVAEVREYVLFLRSECEKMVFTCDTVLASLDFRSERGDSHLHLAVLEDDNAHVLRLLRAGANVDAVNNDLRTPLMYAAFMENLVAMKYLVDFGADTSIHMGDLGTTLHLGCAAEHLSEAVVDRLLRAGADERALNGHGDTPLGLLMHMSSEKEGFGRVRRLLDKAPARRRWVRRWGSLVIIHNRANAEVVGGGGSDRVRAQVRPRMSPRLSGGRAVRALDFLVHRAPKEVLFEVMSFLSCDE